MRASGPTDARLRGGTRAERPLGSALSMARIMEEAWRAPSGASLSGPFSIPSLVRLGRGNRAERGGGAESRTCPPNRPPIHPQFCRPADTIPLDATAATAIVETCFGSRKTNEAWNPGSFGCRGLRVYGVRHCMLPSLRGAAGDAAIQRRTGLLRFARNDGQSCSGVAFASSRRLDPSGSGYLFPFAQLNSTTRSSLPTSP